MLIWVLEIVVLWKTTPPYICFIKMWMTAIYVTNMWTFFYCAFSPLFSLSLGLIFFWLIDRPCVWKIVTANDDDITFFRLGLNILCKAPFLGGMYQFIHSGTTLNRAQVIVLGTHSAADFIFLPCSFSVLLIRPWGDY